MSAKHVGLAFVLVLLVAACGGGATEEPSGGTLGWEMFTYGSGSSDAMDLMIQWSTAELFMPQQGFGHVDIVVLEDQQILAALASGEIDMAQTGTSLLMGAMDQGDLDLVIVGFAKDDEAALFGTRPGITSVEELVPGSTISGGDAGDWDELVMFYILGELGINPEDMNVVGTSGGADSRMIAMLAGQLDGGILQPRNIAPITEAGGAILYEEVRSVPQEAYAVTREMWNDHRDVVCAYMVARIQGLQWASAGPERVDNVPQALEIIGRHGIEPTEAELADWRREIEGNLSLDGGANDAASLDAFVADLRALDLLSEDFEWRDHVDFGCVWEAQEALGLPQRPAPY